MFRDKYRIDNELIKPDDQLLVSLTTRMKAYSETSKTTNENVSEELKLRPRKHLNKTLRYGSLAACFIILILSIAAIGSLNGSKKNATSVSEDSVYMESVVQSVEDRSAGKAPVDSKEDNDDTQEKTSIDTQGEVAQPEEEMATAEVPMAAESITISVDMVDTIVVIDPLSSARNEITINSKAEIVELLNSINSLNLTKAEELSIADSKDKKLTQLKILYKDSNQENNIYLSEHFITLGDGTRYQMEEKEASNLSAIIEGLK